MRDIMQPGGEYVSTTNLVLQLFDEDQHASLDKHEMPAATGDAVNLLKGTIVRCLGLFINDAIVEITSHPNSPKVLGRRVRLHPNSQGFFQPNTHIS